MVCLGIIIQVVLSEGCCGNTSKLVLEANTFVPWILFVNPSLSPSGYSPPRTPNIHLLVPRIFISSYPEYSSPRISGYLSPRTPDIHPLAPRISNSLVPRISNPLVPRISNPLVPRISNPLVPRISNPLVPRISNPLVPRISPAVVDTLTKEDRFEKAKKLSNSRVH